MDYAIALFCLALIGVVWAMTLDRINFERAETIANATKQNANLAVALEEQTIRTLNGVDQVTLFVRNEYLDEGLKLNLRKIVDAGMLDPDTFIFVSVIDERGNVLLNTEQFKPTNVADRDYFKFHQQQDHNQLFVGRPDLGRITGKWTIHMARRINKPDGSFGGVVLAGIDPNYFTNFYQKADLGKDGLVSLVGLDGITRASRAGRVDNSEQDARNRNVLAEHAKSGAGSYSSAGRRSGVPRFISYRTLPQYPLIVMVGTSQAETLASFHQRERNYYRVAASVSIFGLLFMTSLIAALSRHKRMLATLQESEERFRATFEQAAVGIAHTTADKRYLMVNQTFCDMLGYTRDELLAIPTTKLPHPDDRGDYTDMKHLLAGEINTYAGEKRYLRKDGSILWVNRTVSLARDRDGKPLYLIRVIEDIGERKQAEERQAMEHAVTCVLAEAETVAGAADRIIRTICESLGWACGAHWRWDEKAELLRCVETWHIDAADVADFVATAATTVNEAPAWRGEAPRTKTGGLVRRVWMDGAPVWFPDVTRELGFRRGPIAAKAGLHCAFGFPVMAGAQPLGVMEFYSLSTIEKPDEALLQVVQAIGRQIGQFMVRKQAEERIQHLADYDDLTGLPNRNMFHQRLQLALARAHRHARPLAVLFIDLDRFKDINDTFGHEAGDQVLREVAERLRGCLRDSDTIGRLGGDEFVALIEELPQLADVAAVAQKILDAVARPFLLAAQKSYIGASIGISTFPDDGKDEQTLLKNADAAMYHAKEQGRNNYQFYSAQMAVSSTGFSETLMPVDTSEKVIE